MSTTADSGEMHKRRSGEAGSGRVPELGEMFVCERMVLDALVRAIVVTAPDGRIFSCNHAAESLYGWAEEEIIGRPVSEVFAPVVDGEAVTTIPPRPAPHEAWHGKMVVTSRDGQQVQLHVTGRPILDPAGEIVALVSSSEDVTHQQMLERRAADAAEHLALALEAGGLGTWRWDMATGITQWDAKIEELFGVAPGEFDGTFDAWVSLLHPDDRASTLRELEEAVAAKRSYVVQHRVVWPDGSVHWLQGKGQVTVDEAGNATGTIGCTADVTDQMLLAIERENLTKAAVEAAEKERLSRERLEFLGKINEALATATTRDAVMRNVTQAAVPRLGDWCAIFVLPSAESEIPDVEVAHVNSKALEHVRRWQEQFPYDPAARVGIPAVIRSGRSGFYPEISERMIESADAPQEARALLRALSLRSAILVPLVKRGRVVGAMQFVNSMSSREYTPDDLALAEAAAGRIASTLENIRLSEHQRTIATTLQASLLPDTLPEIPSIDIAVRYWAAGEGTEVGGDFYDVFEVGDHHAVVIGDVCGTGPGAAAMTALARHTIRAAAWQGATHDQALLQLNNAILRSGRATFCTALFCTLTPTENGFRFEVAAGGHPLPILVRAGARAHSVGRPGTLLGLLHDATSHTASNELVAGDTLVLYTDGATDVRPPHDLTTEQLEAIVERAATDASEAAQVADRLGQELSAILPISERNDDIALLVLKVARG